MEKRARRRLAQKLRLLRLVHEWSQEELAAASGLDRSYIGSIERGERNVSLDTMESLSNAFGITLNELLAVPNATDIGEILLERIVNTTERKES